MYHYDIGRKASKSTHPHLLRPSRHDRTALFSAEVCYGTIEHVDLVEEIYSCGNKEITRTCGIMWDMLADIQRILYPTDNIHIDENKSASV